jgi:exosortase
VARQDVLAIAAVTGMLALPRLVPFWWHDAVHSLGLLVAPWVVWRILRLRGEGVSEDAGAWAIAAATVALWGWRTADPFIALAGLALGLLTVATARGPPRRAALPLAALLLTVPPPGFEAMLLAAQKFVAVASAAGLAAIGIASERSGFQLATANHLYSVEPLCTGLSGVLATAALVLMTAEHLRPGTGRMALALAVGLGVVLALNVVRIVALVALTEAQGPRWIEGAFHETLSLALSILAVLAVLPFLLRPRST